MGLLENMVGSVKDKASITKATLLSKPTNTSKALSLRLAVVRATTHNPSSLPSTTHLTHLLSFSNSVPRATAYAVVDALMTRLFRTRSAVVALKCLLVLHVVVHRGPFILHDQLSLFLSTPSGRRNHLNLSAFRDGSSIGAWEISTWVRWYARYLEQILTSSRALGHFPFSLSCHLEREKATENIPSLLNGGLLREIGALIDVLEEIARCPESLGPGGEGKLVSEVTRLVADDYSVAVNDLESRIGEFAQRMGYLSFGDSVELVCALRRVEGCRGKLSELFPLTAKEPASTLWRLARRLSEEVVAASKSVEGKAVVSWRQVGRSGGSARLDDRVANLVRFSSNRYAF